MIKIGVIGCGYWGPNLVRNFIACRTSDVKICCDKSQGRLRYIKGLHPNIEVTQDAEKLFRDPELDAIYIATPVATHYSLAKAALQSDKHVLVEKPITDNSRHAQELIDLASKRKRVLMAGHTFEYSPSVNAIKKILKSGKVGDILYISSARLNLGLFQKDINVIWDLAPHDVSILNYLLGSVPLYVESSGISHVRKGIEDVAMLSVGYRNKTMAFLHLSWLDPCKVRRFVIVGTKKMIVYDDLNPEEPIKIYDKGISKQPYYDTFGEFKLLYRFGDTHSPRVETTEPLKVECHHFLDCIKTGRTPRSDGRSGLNVVRVIEAAQRSLKNGGRKQRI